MENFNELILKYFSYGFRQKEILDFLKALHSVSISQRTLKRLLFKLRLYRRLNFTPIRRAFGFIEEELKTSRQLHGYRWMHLRCIQNDLIVTQNVVREILRMVDPESYVLRTRKHLRRRQYHNKGPNYLWHMDSYDKLKPYGICIIGCIDGFSRHIIWMRVGRTSSDPKKDVDQVVQEWNTQISRSRNSISPSGRPITMYEIPSLYGTRSYVTPVSCFAIDEISSTCTFNNYPCEENFFELCNIIMAEKQLSVGDNHASCIELYKVLRQSLRSIFNIVK